MLPGIMIAVVWAVAAIMEPGDLNKNAKIEKPPETFTEIVLDDPQSLRFKIGEIDWAQVEKER